MLRLAFVTGTEPGKWFARYRETTDHGLKDIPSDDPFATLIDDRADLALLRLPDPRVGAPGERFHQVQLYPEKPGVAVPKDSVYAELYAKGREAVRLSDLADEHVNYRFGVENNAGAGEYGASSTDGDSDVSESVDAGASSSSGAGNSIDELRAALQVVAANVGIAFAPAPLLKMLSKKQVVVLEVLDDASGARPVGAESGAARAGAADARVAGSDAESGAAGAGVADARVAESDAEPGAAGAPRPAETSIALVWKVENDSEAIQDFVGVAKGRTRNSSRGGGVSRGKASEGRGTSKSGRASEKRDRKVKGKTSAQRKGFRSKHPKTGVRGNRR